MLTLGPQRAETLLQRASLRSLFLVIIGLRRHCHVVGNSMIPTLHQGDIVIYRPINSHIFLPKEGCIVVVEDPQQPKSLIIKRVHKENSLGLELRGDNQENSIDSRQFGLVNHNYLRGIVEHIIPKTNQNRS